MKFNKQASILFFLILIAVTALVKYICAPRLDFSGVTGVMSVALFAGLMPFKAKNAFLVPLVALFVTNVIIEILFKLNLFVFEGFYKWQLLEYALTLVLTVVGMLLRKYKTTGIFVAAFVGPTLYFIVSNFFSWALNWQLFGYSHNMQGLMTAYTAGLPFYRNSIISTVVFLPSFIMLYQWMVKGKPTLALAA